VFGGGPDIAAGLTNVTEVPTAEVASVFAVAAVCVAADENHVPVSEAVIDSLIDDAVHIEPRATGALNHQCHWRSPWPLTHRESLGHRGRGFLRASEMAEVLLPPNDFHDRLT